MKTRPATLIRVLAVTGIALTAPLAQAQTPPGANTCAPPCARLDAWFEVRYGPFHLADITLSAHETTRTYAAEGHVASAGLIRLIRDFHFDLSVTGTRHEAAFQPDHFVGDLDTGRRSVQVEMTYPGGVPTILSIAPPEPPGPWRIEATDQTGTIDPLTALYRITRPRALPDLCDWSTDLYDGRRRARLTLAPAQSDHDLMRCQGTYQRVAGYSPDELRDYQVLAFELWFAPTATSEWQLTRAATHTPYGVMRINRTF